MTKNNPTSDRRRDLINVRRMVDDIAVLIEKIQDMNGPEEVIDLCQQVEDAIDRIEDVYDERAGK